VIRALDTWGEKAGYPEYHVGNFYGSLESMLAHQTIQASATPATLNQAPRKIKVHFFMNAADFANRCNRTGLLIARGDEIWPVQYRFNQTADLRFSVGSRHGLLLHRPVPDVDRMGNQVSVPTRPACDSPRATVATPGR